MRSTISSLIIASALLLASCGAGVPHASSSTKCTADFRNDTQNVLTDSELAAAWAHAQKVIAEGHWVINAVHHPRCGDPAVTCQYQPATDAALSLKPECLGVRGTQGEPYPGADGVTDDSHNIAIRLDQGHDRAWALVSYEMENCLGMRLGFPMGDR
jgi:hypothetical protein